MKSSFFGDELEQLYPIIEDGGSDSAAFDNVLELLVINGVLSLPEAIMMMVPEAWQDNDLMDPKKAAFYEWAACLMEPWDGPALFTFADGRYCGATLDRNGLRPCRFYVTDDDRIICASEVGAFLIDPERIVQKGRLKPGRMLLVDTVEGRIVDDKELKLAVSSRFDFTSWIEEQLLTIHKVYDQLKNSGVNLKPSLDDISLQKDPRLHAFGYSFEQVGLILGPMVNHYISLGLSHPSPALTKWFNRLPIQKKRLGPWGTTLPLPVWQNSLGYCMSTFANSSHKSRTHQSIPFVRLLSCLLSVTSGLRAMSWIWTPPNVTACSYHPRCSPSKNSML